MRGHGARRDHWLVLAVMALAAAVRLPTLGQQSYWADEAATLSVLRTPLADMFSAIVHRESTPPLYYLLARAWSAVTGLGEYGLRSLSAVAGIATVGLVCLAARRIAGMRAGAIAGVLAALSPLLVWYSQEARSYALLAMFGALSFLCATQAVDATDDGPRPWRALACWGLAAVLALCTHYFAVLFVAPEAVWLLLRRRRARWPVTAVGAAALALLPLALAQRSSGHTDWITGTPLRTRLALVPKQFATGLSAPHQTALAVVVVLAVVLLVGDLLRRRARIAEAGLVAALTVVGAVLALAALAVVGIDLVLTRNAIGVLPIAVVALAVALELAISRGAVAVAAITLTAIVGVSATAVAAMFTDATYQRPDWRGASQLVDASRALHVVVLEPSSDALALGAYVLTLRHSHTPRIRTSEVDVVQFLLTTQGANRAPTAVRVPAPFRVLEVHGWPDIEVTRLIARGKTRLDLARLAPAANVYLVAGGR
jgi:mannosyltransferase